MCSRSRTGSSPPSARQSQSQSELFCSRMPPAFRPLWLPVLTSASPICLLALKLNPSSYVCAAVPENCKEQGGGHVLVLTSRSLDGDPSAPMPRPFDYDRSLHVRSPPRRQPSATQCRVGADGRLQER